MRSQLRELVVQALGERSRRLVRDTELLLT